MVQRGDSFTVDRFRLAAQVVHTLVIREFKTRFGRYHFGYPWALANAISPQPTAHRQQQAIPSKSDGRHGPDPVFVTPFRPIGINVSTPNEPTKVRVVVEQTV